jgi:hypothetical protein
MQVQLWSRAAVVRLQKNWFKVTECASDYESGRGLKSDVLSLRGSPRGSQRILSTV